MTAKVESSLLRHLPFNSTDTWSASLIPEMAREFVDFVCNICSTVMFLMNFKLVINIIFYLKFLYCIPLVNLSSMHNCLLSQIYFVEWNGSVKTKCILDVQYTFCFSRKWTKCWRRNCRIFWMTCWNLALSQDLSTSPCIWGDEKRWWSTLWMSRAYVKFCVLC